MPQLPQPPQPPQPLIVTLQLDAGTFDLLDRLRQQHFPPERNVLAAHVTLFHALPGSEIDFIRFTLREVCREQPAFTLALPKPRFLGRGVAIEVQSSDVLRVRAELAQRWRDWLTPQDRQPYRPHVTVQNKVSAGQAHQLYEHLKQEWTPQVGQGRGLVLWRYMGGPWEFVEAMPFAE